MGSAVPSREVNLIHAISEIIAGTAGYQEGLRLTVKQIASDLRADSCSIFVHDPDENALRVVATYGLEQTSVGKIALGADEGLTGHCFAHGRAVHVADMAKDARSSRLRAGPAEGDPQHRALLAVPLVVGGRCIGALDLTRRAARRFAVNAVATAKAVAALRSATRTPNSGAVSQSYVTGKRQS